MKKKKKEARREKDGRRNECFVVTYHARSELCTLYMNVWNMTNICIPNNVQNILTMSNEYKFLIYYYSRKSWISAEKKSAIE